MNLLRVSRCICVRYGSSGILIAASVASSPARAEEPGVFTLGEIRVSAPAEAAAAGSSSVSAEEMDLFDRNTVGRAIEMLPGVTLSSMGARNEQTAYVRGFDLRQAPLLMDGIPVYVPYDGYVDLGRFTTFDLSKIQVSKGWVSVLDGPNTMGGAINLVSRRPEQGCSGLFQTGARFDRRAGFEGYDTAATLALRKQLFWAQASGSWLDRDHFRLSRNFASGAAENGGVRENSDAQDWKANVKLAFTPSEQDEYSLSYVQQHGEKGTPPYAGTDPEIKARYWRWPEWDKRSFYWLSKTGFDHGLSLRTTAFHDTFENSLFAYDDDDYDSQLKKSSFRSYYDDYSYGGAVEGAWLANEQHALRAAFHYKRDVHREHDRGEPERTMSDDTYSAGLEYNWKVTPEFELVVGGGYDWRRGVEAEDFQKNVVSDLPTLRSHVVKAQAAAIYHYDDDGALHLSVSNRGRFPTLKERYSYRMGTALPNPGLDTETAIHYELGVSDQLWGHTRVDAAIFYVDLDDAIQNVDIGPDLTQMQNIGDAVHRGFELGVRSLPLPELEIGLSYTFIDRVNRTDRDVKLTDTPESALFAFLNYEVLDGLHLVPNLQLASSRYLTTDGKRGDDFAVAGFAVRWEPRDGVAIELGADNLLDANYTLSDGFPESGRSYFAKTSLRF